MAAGFFKNTLTVENRGGRVGSGIWDSYLPLIYFKPSSKLIRNSVNYSFTCREILLIYFRSFVALINVYN